MIINSDEFRTLKKWNRKALTKRNVRVGVVVDTKRGLGIIVHRDKGQLWVAHKSDNPLIKETYRYNIEDVNLSSAELNESEKWVRFAWIDIENSALNLNQMYEVERNKAIVNEYLDSVEGEKKVRNISGGYTSATYVRITGSNEKFKYDFEICTNRPDLRDGDKIMYVLGLSDKVKCINGYGRIYTRKASINDVNYGLCKYVFNLDDDGDKIYD